MIDYLKVVNESDDRIMSCKKDEPDGDMTWIRRRRIERFDGRSEIFIAGEHKIDKLPVHSFAEVSGATVIQAEYFSK